MIDIEYKIWSYDLNVDWEEYQPIIEDNFMMDLIISISEKGKSGSDDFYLKVCTLKWLEHNTPISWGKNFLIVDKYRKLEFLNEVIKKINEIKIKCKSFDEFQEWFGRYAKWEFEDYNGS